MTRLRQLARRWLADPSLRLFALLSLALISVAVSTAAQLRAVEPALLVEMALVGAALAWLAAAVNDVRAGFAAAGLAAVGLVRTVWRVGRLGAPAWAAAEAALVAYWRWLLNPFQPGSSLNLAPLAEAVARLGTQLSALTTRLGAWLQGFVLGIPSFDPLGAALVWAALLWCLATWAAWQLRRRARPLPALLPLLALSAYSSFYSGASASALLPPLAALLLLMAFASHRGQQRIWRQQGVAAAGGLGSRLALTAVPLALALVAVAAVVPSLSYERGVRWLQRLSGPRAAGDSSLGDSLGLQQLPQYDSPLYSARTAGLPNRHLVGSGAELSEQIVMNVTVFNLPLDGPPPRFYWRALTYDRYSGQGWVSSPTVTWSYGAGEAIEPELPHDPTLIRQMVRTAEQESQLAYHSGHLLSADHGFEVAWRTTQRDAFATSVASKLYRVRSLISDASPAELRAAGNDYPQWVRERYLRLPDDVPNRVLALARDLTAGAPTAYDRADLLEQHLRAIPYDLDVPLPPDDRDVVDWFLFDLQRGYCDYYASAMVVLARAAGLPARFVVGYYTGTAEQTEGTYHYVVSAADAHAWVEIYFPDYGWIEFDPTAGRPPLDRTAPQVEAEPAAATGAGPAPISDLAFRRLTDAGARAAALALASGLAVAVGLIFLDFWRLRRRSSRRAIGSLYQRLARLAARLGLGAGASPTPYEFGQALTAQLGSPDTGRLAAALSPARGEIDYFIELTVRAAYSRRPVAPGEVPAAWHLWWRLAPRVVLAALFRRERAPSTEL